MEITFISPVYLWFLACIPFFIALHLLTLRFVKRRAMNFANFEAIKRVGTGLKGGRILSRNIVLLVMRLFTLLFLIFALAGTVLWYYGKSSDFDFVLAIDASGSMLADDFIPNRLEAAKKAALSFMDEIPRRAKVAVISFAGTTFVKQRLTEDFFKVKEAINSMEIEFASGTAIGDAIISSANQFEEGERAKVVVLLTDGQSNVGTLPEEAIQYANDNHVTVNTIGVATEKGGEFAEIDIISRLDEDTLKSIAANTGGKYYKAENVEELSKAYKEIATTAEKKVPVKLTMPFMLIAFLLIFVEWILINTRYRTIP
jgi:Ca-activated chloride channel family protein